MAKKPRTQDETSFDIARSGPWVSKTIVGAAERLAARDPEGFGAALIAELLAVREPLRYMEAEKEGQWLDMAGASSLAAVEQLQKVIAMRRCQDEEQKMRDLAAHMVCEEMEDVSPLRREVLQELVDARHAVVMAGQRLDMAAKKLTLLLGKIDD